MCSNQSAYGFNYFYPEIVQGFNLGSRTITLVCTAPPYLVGAFVSFAICWSSDRRAERGYHITGSVLVAVVGFIISTAFLNVPARYTSSFLYISGVFGANPVVFSWAAYTVSRTPEKKACAMAIINIVGQLGSIWSPFFFDPSEQPRYITAMILLIAFCGLEVLLCMTMKFLLGRANKKLEAEYEGTDRAPNLFVR